MRVLQVYLLNENGKQGYLAVTDKMAGGRQEAIKYIGTKFGVDFPLGCVSPQLRVKTVRSSVEFAKYIKMFNPMLMLNPIRVGSVIFDLPFIHYANGITLKWTPYFEGVLKEDSFSLVSDGSIIEYMYQQPIYISPLDMRRHMSAFNQERLLINANTYYTTRELSAVENGMFCEVAYHVNNGVWVRDSLNKMPIAGYKMR